MQVKFIQSINELSLAQWNALDTQESPFINFEFLSALENHHCVGESLGWLPYHLVVMEGEKLLAFMPLYLKYNSYGELVFDWSWADAYQRAGLPYYPKLVSAIPYTPVTGMRIVLNKETSRSQVLPVIDKALQEQLTAQDISGFHCLFPSEDEMQDWMDKGYIRRLGCQFHWHNQKYESFDHYVSFFTSRKRKNIKKERRSVSEQGFHFKMLAGDQIEEDLWPMIYQLYEITFHKKGGLPTFTLDFFKAMGQQLGSQFLVNLASYHGQYVACAIFYRNNEFLYGRHWGCFEEYHNLHFETCYYQGLDFAIAHNLQTFEPGAEGEHKVSRGFLPTKTWSVHKLAHPVFAKIIGEFVSKEEAYMNEYIAEVAQHSPFKK